MASVARVAVEAGRDDLMSFSTCETCLVVDDVEAAVRNWVSSTGAGPFYMAHSHVLLERRYRGKPATDEFVAALGFMGELLMEFIQPLNSEPSIFREILDERGSGALHHVVPRLGVCADEQYDALHAQYVRQGMEPALTFTIPGGRRNAFFDGKGSIGAFVELLETREADALSLERRYQEHLCWDGSDPIRKLF